MKKETLSYGKNIELLHVLHHVIFCPFCLLRFYVEKEYFFPRKMVEGLALPALSVFDPVM